MHSNYNNKQMILFLGFREQKTYLYLKSIKEKVILAQNGV